MYTREWLIAKTRFYQDFGFFEEYIGLSDDELADEIIRLRQAETRTDISKLFIPGWDVLLVPLDKKRVLRAAADILYAEYPNPYNFDSLVETIQKLSAISRGAFLPQNIQEVSPGTISFILNGDQYSLIPDGAPNDPLILASQINPMILKTGYQFKQHNASPDIFLYVMTSEEVKRLGWKFLADGCFMNSYPT
ncbi:hypothetical protein VB713_01700 [Anabaena cylindrica UHCC 0172]|uniref:hypothetical protein n=1 Tax=Anabaena cylindrica TaxID=1165 RepID=UPI002B219E3E|nr:hypothetical protein [Anabaena cylindrica]MEA5549704.1 hypothetical protein [Anabaena cylindrica UHCC 0172]